MSGIYGFFSPTGFHCSNNYNRFFSSSLNNIINEEYTSDSFIYGRSVINKFTNDRFLYEDDHFVMGIEGLIYNYENPSVELPKVFKRQGISFIKDLQGSFSGFIYDKTNKKIHLFTDHLATRSLFYYINSSTKTFFFASELKALTSLLADLEIQTTPDKDGFNALLTFGYLFQDSTLVNEIKRLRFATIYSYDLELKKVNTQRYFNFDITPSSINKEVAIEKIDKLLLRTIREEWSKDKSYNKAHLTTLSGGLDARVNTFLAKELGYKDIHVLNFSEQNTPDHSIAKEMAHKEHFGYTFYPLDKGHYFVNSFEELVASNDGMVTILGASHMFKALQTLSLDQYGGLHTGQIGGTVFGSFTRPNFNLQKDIGKLGYVNDEEILSQISVLPAIKKKYSSSVELFAFEQRLINGTLNGDRQVSHYIDLQSPFYDKTIITFFHSLPQKFKLNKNIYLKWIRERHPQMFNYKWDSAGITPKNKYLTTFFKQFNKVKGYAKRYLLGKDKAVMNPFENWYQTNAQLQDQIAEIFHKNLYLIEEPWLRTNISKIYRNHKARGKFAATTAILAYKMHFSEPDK